MHESWNTGYINKPTRCTFCVYILQSSYNSTCFERPFRSSSGVHDLLYSAALYKPCKRVCRHVSKHVELYKNCRINTYRKCVLLVCLYNRLDARYIQFQITADWVPEDGISRCRKVSEQKLVWFGIHGVVHKSWLIKVM